MNNQYFRGNWPAKTKKPTKELKDINKNKSSHQSISNSLSQA